MSLPPGLRWALTIAFAIFGGYCLLRCVVHLLGRSSHRAIETVSDVAHLAMSAAMIAMLWSVARADRWGAQLAVFALASLWFLVRATDPEQPRGYRAGLLHQGVAMAAMCWMFLMMTGSTAPAMAGMSGPAHAGGATAGDSVITIGFAGYLGLAALWWLRACFSPAPSTVGLGVASAANAGNGATTLMLRTLFRPVTEATCQALMSAAMGLTLAASL